MTQKPKLPDFGTPVKARSGINFIEREGNVVGHYGELVLIDFCTPIDGGHRGHGYPGLVLAYGYKPLAHQCWYVHVDDVKLAEPSEPAPREPTAPMTKSVLDLMRRKGALTSMEAQGVLRCRQLPARILELKRLGHKIVTEMKADPTGQKYARYHLQAAT